MNITLPLVHVHACTANDSFVASSPQVIHGKTHFKSLHAKVSMHALMPDSKQHGLRLVREVCASVSSTLGMVFRIKLVH